MNIKQIFIQFLKTEGVAKQYRDNWDENWKPHGPIKQRGRYLTHSFYWDASPEGWEFWHIINGKWNRLIQALAK